MLYRLLMALVVLVLSAGLSAAELKTALEGDTFKVNGNATKMGKANWAEPEKSWRTVGEHIKTAVPPANKDGTRPEVTLVCAIDEAATWGALQSLLMAAGGLGIEKARIDVPGKPGAHVLLPLPGADPSSGQVVPVPLSLKDGKLMTSVGGQPREATHALFKGMVKQLPDATAYVTAPPDMPANKVLGILRVLHQDVKHKAVAFLPVKAITAEEKKERKEAESAVDRAFGGGALGQ